MKSCNQPTAGEGHCTPAGAQPCDPCPAVSSSSIRAPTCVNDLCLQDGVTPHDALAQAALLSNVRHLTRPVAVGGCRQADPEMKRQGMVSSAAVV